MAKRTTQTTTQSTPVATLVADAGAETATQPAAPVQAPETPEAVAAAAAAAEAAEEARVEALQEAAEKALTACRKAYTKGDKAHRQGLLESGRLASEYIALRMEAGATRAVAVQVVEGELAKVAWDKVDVNRLVRCYHVYRLLCDGYRAVTEATADPDVPYSHLRDVWTDLVQRVEDPKQERWQLLPGQEQAAVAEFVHCVKEHLDVAAVTSRVKAVQAAYAAQEARRKQDREEELVRAAQAQEQQAQKARAEAMEQAKLKADAERALKAAQDKAKQDASEEAAAAVQEAADKLAREQRAMVEAQAKAEQEQREKARLERERRELERERQRAAERAAKQAAKDEAAAKAKQGKDKPQADNAASHPGVASTRELESRGRSGAAQGREAERDVFAALTKATAKDAAQQLAAVVVCHETAPDDVVEELLKALVVSKELCPATKRALKAALTLLHRPEQPTAQPKPQEQAQDTPEDAGQELARAIADATPERRLSKAERKQAKREARRQARASSPSPVDIAAHLTPQVNGTPAAHAGK